MIKISANHMIRGYKEGRKRGEAYQSVLKNAVSRLGTTKSSLPTCHLRPRKIRAGIIQSNRKN